MLFTTSWVTRNTLASFRRSVSWGIARKTASENIAKCGEKKQFSTTFSLAVFRAMPS